jgi:hypothetical protein
LVNFGCRPQRTPGASRSTKKIVGAAPAFVSAFATTRTNAATSPPVTNHFSPLRRQPSLSRRATVCKSETSEPAPGSVMA